MPEPLPENDIPTQPVRRAVVWACVIFNFTGFVLLVAGQEGWDWIEYMVPVELVALLVSLLIYATMKKPRHRLDRPAVLLAMLGFLLSMFSVTGAMY